ncbi:MAG: FliH/SctL family protein [Sandaracinaceae bacterium]
MSEGLWPETLAFPRLEQTTTTPHWMRPTETEVRTVNFGEVQEPRISAPPEPEPEPEPEPDLDAIRQLLDAEREALVAERAALDAERELASSEEQRAKERFVAAAAKLGATRTEVPEELEEPLLQLAVGIAEVLVEQAVQDDPELHKTLASAALAAIERTEETTLLASREAYAAIVEVAGAPILRAADGGEVRVELDAGLSGLGVVAKVGPGRVDARLRERLTRVREALIHERRLQRGEMS